MTDELTEEVLNMKFEFVSCLTDSIVGYIGQRTANELNGDVDKILDSIFDDLHEKNLDYPEMLYSVCQICTYLGAFVKFEYEKMKLSADVSEWGVNDE